MNQLYYIKKEKLEWRETTTPIINGSLQAIVRPFAVAKCDLDDIYLFNNMSTKLTIGSVLGIVDKDFHRLFGKNFFKGPFPFGHECVAEVVETGDQVKNIKVGDVVTVPFQISCGSCINCNSGVTGSCSNTPLVSTYGFGTHLQFGGAMSDLIKVPYADSMLIKIPDHIDPVHLASLSDNIPDAYRNVGPELEKNPNKSILVIGGKVKSIGLYTVLIAKAMGATRIDYTDYSDERLELARRCGADHAYEFSFDIPELYDIVVEANSDKQGLLKAIKYVKPNGLISSSGIYLKKMKMPLIEMYSKGVTFRTGLANSRADAEKVLKLIAKKKTKSRIGNDKSRLMG
ncbi:MAG: alcohol dehydrogenase catalytic domain-containing protein [Sporocytophaga sp.]|nr:alcohol dehydrogenase catalytic domain-containing protein [Sporocytophaga sp.]